MVATARFEATGLDRSATRTAPIHRRPARRATRAKALDAGARIELAAQVSARSAARRCVMAVAKFCRSGRGPATGPRTGRSDGHPFGAIPKCRSAAAACVPPIISRLYAGSRKSLPAHTPVAVSALRCRFELPETLKCRDKKTLLTTRLIQHSFA